MRALSLAPLILLTACDLIEAIKPLEVPEALSDCQAADGDSYSYGGFDTGTSGGASIDGDTLSVDVSYGGGCEEHEWVLCWPDQSFQESDPVQATLDIWHGIDSDTVCDAYLSETLTFDLAPLKAQYQEGYQTESGTIIIHIGDEAVEYTF